MKYTHYEVKDLFIGSFLQLICIKNHPMPLALMALKSTHPGKAGQLSPQRRDKMR